MEQLLNGIILASVVQIVKGVPLIETTNSTCINLTSSTQGNVPQRSLWEIFLSCGITISTCTWVALHPNIPKEDEPWWKTTRRQIRLMIYGIIAPEPVVYTAMQEWNRARKTAREMNWTITHGFFLHMGGMVADNGQERVKLNLFTYEEYVKENLITTNITLREIKDKSKSDALSKGLVVMQTTWFVIQCFARRIRGLPITELELVTLAFAVLNLVTYAFWWHKPLGVQCPIIVSTIVLLDCLPTLYPSTEMGSFEVEDTALAVEPVEADIGVSSLAHLDDLPGDMTSVTSAPNSSPDAESTQIVTKSTDEGLDGASSQLIVHQGKKYTTGNGSSTPRYIWRSYYKLLEAPLGCVLTLLALIPRALLGLLGALNRMLFIRYLWNPNESFWDEQWDMSPILPLGSILVGFAFGGIHCIGWSFQFPSHAESLIWRISSSIITCLPSLPLIGILIPSRHPQSSPWLKFACFFYSGDGPKTDLTKLLFIFLIYSYILARIALLVIAFKSLWNLPSDAAALIDLNWSKFFPHL